MEVLKYILMVCLCVLVTVIICMFMRPDACMHTCVPCTHLDSDPELVTLVDFNLYAAAVKKVQEAQQKNNEANLVAVKAFSVSIVENRKAILTHQDQMKRMAEGIIELAKIIKRLVEVSDVVDTKRL